MQGGQTRALPKFGVGERKTNEGIAKSMYLQGLLLGLLIDDEMS